MEPIFSLTYAEFCVAQRLQRLLPAAQGYAVYVPASRQEPGVDLVIVRRKRSRTAAATIQVKSSRTYSPAGNSIRKATRFRYHTWFNTFECPDQADFFCLVALYPAIDVKHQRELGTWGAPQILVFSQSEMRTFLRSVKTVGGKRDPMFGFGFDDPEVVYQTRGDRHRRFLDFSDHLLERRVTTLRRFLEPESVLPNMRPQPTPQKQRA